VEAKALMIAEEFIGRFLLILCLSRNESRQASCNVPSTRIGARRGHAPVTGLAASRAPASRHSCNNASRLPDAHAADAPKDC
jgi:hypothetical protein